MVDLAVHFAAPASPAPAAAAAPAAEAVPDVTACDIRVGHIVKVGVQANCVMV
jgi:hypothetical protein